MVGLYCEYMATTINIDSYDDINLKQTTSLTSAVSGTTTQLQVASSANFATGGHVIVGNIARDGAEMASVASVDDGTTITLSEGLKLAHRASEPVTSVVGDVARVYRAPYVEGQLPDDASFTQLVDRPLEVDQPSTYYRDPDGSSAYWYRYTYASSTTTDETTPLAAVRGDDFGHYASLSEIRKAAGFVNATNLQDIAIDIQRRTAESEINSAFASGYTTPFDPVPPLIHTLTIQLAAALLRDAAFHTSETANEVKAARQAIKDAVESGQITDDDGNSLNGGSRIGYAPDENAPRAFRMGQVF